MTAARQMNSTSRVLNKKRPLPGVKSKYKVNDRISSSSSKVQSNNYYFGSSSQPPTIPYEAIQEALRPNTGQTLTQKIRNKALCPICNAFQHYNRYTLRQHIEGHSEFKKLRSFMLTSERRVTKNC